MAQFGDTLNMLRKRDNLTQKELAEKLGISFSAISMYERGKREPDFETLEAIADYFNVNMNFLLGKEPASFAKISAVRIPVLGKVAAGIPITAVENIIDYEEIPSSMAETGEYVALQINGSIMEPRMFEGDVVIVKVQPTVDSGEVAVVIINGNEATVKKVQLRSDGIVLQPFNSAYDPMFYTNEDIEHIPVRIFGKVVECRQKY